ncbi:hypothetical protein CAPTEDRAFT_100436, partial [Capitella teleta]
LLISPLLHILNFSFLKRTVPCKMKIARVVPLFKKGFIKKFVTTDPFLSCLCSETFWRN